MAMIILITIIAPAPDKVQVYCLKNLKSIYKLVGQKWDKMMNKKEVLSAWMKKSRTVLYQKDYNKENKVGNFRPVSFLPHM